MPEKDLVPQIPEDLSTKEKSLTPLARIIYKNFKENGSLGLPADFHLREEKKSYKLDEYTAALNEVRALLPKPKFWVNRTPYERVEKLGEGNLAEVFLAKDHDGQLGTLKKYGFVQPETLRFIQESILFRSQCGISDQQVIDCINFDPNSRTAVFNYIPEVPDVNVILPAKEQVFRIKQIINNLLKIIAPLSDEGFLHSDVKPENLILRKKHTPALIDIDTFTSIDAGVRWSSNGSHMLVTPNYIAPEYVRGQLTKVSDVYSVGMTTAALIHSYINKEIFRCFEDPQRTLDLKANGDSILNLDNLDPSNCSEQIRKEIYGLIEFIKRATQDNPSCRVNAHDGQKVLFDEGSFAMI